jgi:hypothetical protein
MHGVLSFNYTSDILIPENHRLYMSSCVATDAIEPVVFTLS